MSVEALGRFIHEKVNTDNAPGLSVARRRR
jgi:hypothetical protein